VNIHTRETNHQTVILPRLRLSMAKLVGWRGLAKVTRRPWSARLPCVIGASLLLVLLLAGIGVPSKDLYFVLLLPLLGVPVALILSKGS
jgi:hypothetical protein